MAEILELPYDLPASLRGKIDRLADLLGIRNKIYLNSLPEDAAVELLTLIILYRHLGEVEKRRVADLLRRVDRRVLNDLQFAIAIPSVQPSWGMWSLTNEELISRKETLSTFNSLAGYLGFGASYQTFSDLRKLGSMTAKGGAAGVATLMIAGFVWLQELEEGNIDAELMRRLK